jgi:AcrR family transcriptional regulator
MSGNRVLQPNAKAVVPDAAIPPLRLDREARRDALLEAAAAEFNAHGVSRASISRIAKAKGLTRAAVYYYVRDRDDLVFQAYRKSCQVMAADLAAATAAGGDGLARLSTFIRLSLDPRRSPPAVLSELDYLTGEARETIAAAHAANVETLRGMIQSGVETGAIRSCDDEVIAQSIVGLIAWVPLSEDWVEGKESSYRARTVESLVDLIAGGETADPAYDFAPPVAINLFFPVSPNPFDREAVAAAKLDHLLMTASQVFNRRGIDGASLDDVVGALGATKGALYHYLDNKTDLVVRCQERATSLYEKFVEAADRLGRHGLDKACVGLYLLIQSQACGLSPLIQMSGSQALPPKARRALLKRNRALQQRYEGFGELGLRDGSMRPLDYAAVSQLGAGAFEWLPKWFQPGDPRAGSALAAEIIGLFVHGLKRR